MDKLRQDLKYTLRGLNKPGFAIAAVHVVGKSVVPLLVGQGLGLAGAFVLTRFVAAFLYGVNPTDLVTFAATPIVMVIVALCAAYLPARRAVTVDPTAALRQE